MEADFWSKVIIKPFLLGQTGPLVYVSLEDMTVVLLALFGQADTCGLHCAWRKSCLLVHVRRLPCSAGAAFVCFRPAATSGMHCAWRESVCMCARVPCSQVCSHGVQRTCEQSNAAPFLNSQVDFQPGSYSVCSQNSPSVSCGESWQLS